MISSILQYLNRVNHGFFFGITSCTYYLSFMIIDKILCKLPFQHAKTYSKYDEGRRIYILSNIMKSAIISFVGGIFCKSVYDGNLNLLQTNEWVTQYLLAKNLIGIYSMTDVVPLFLNRDKMMQSTLIHHVCVGLSHLYVINSDFSNEGIFKAVLVYGGFSSLASCVNFYLGARFLTTRNKTIKRMKLFALMSYVLSCAGNWSWQTFYLAKLCYGLTETFDIFTAGSLLFYGGMLKSWIVDDIVLMTHLASNKSSTKNIQSNQPRHMD